MAKTESAGAVRVRALACADPMLCPTQGFGAKEGNGGGDEHGQEREDRLA